MRGRHQDGLYILNHMYHFIPNIGERASQETWHNRLGHRHFQIFQNIFKNFEIPVSHHVRHFICDACCSSKSHKLPSKVSLHTSSKPLELIHSDVWGSTPKISHFSFKCYAIFVDDFTKYTWLLTEQDRVVVNCTRSRVKNNSKLTNLMKIS